MTHPAPVRHRWDEMPKEELGPGLKRRIVTGDELMISHVYFEKGRTIAPHSHPNEQLTYILEGALEFTFGEAGETMVVAAGEVLQIPSDVPHAAVALEDTLDVDVFYPPRTDWLDGSDAYLRQPETAD